MTNGKLGRLLNRYQQDLKIQDYSPKVVISGLKVINLERCFVDDSGELTEIGRLDANGALSQIPDFKVKQVTYTRLEPGAIKAWHLHLVQTDVWFVPSPSRLLFGLVDLRKDSPSQEKVMRLAGGAGRNQLVLIPPGVAHGMANPYPAPAELIYLTDQHFDPVDEFRLPWDYFGTDFWQPQRT